MNEEETFGYSEWKILNVQMQSIYNVNKTGIIQKYIKVIFNYKLLVLLFTKTITDKT